MMFMNISAMTMEEAELMLKVLDQWLRHYYNVYGAHRETSFSRRGNLGIRAQIRVRIEKEMWDYVRDGVMYEITHRLDKGCTYYLEQISDTLQVIEFSTTEAEI